MLWIALANVGKVAAQDVANPQEAMSTFMQDPKMVSLSMDMQTNTNTNSVKSLSHEIATMMESFVASYSGPTPATATEVQSQATVSSTASYQTSLEPTGIESASILGGNPSETSTSASEFGYAEGASRLGGITSSSSGYGGEQGTALPVDSMPMNASDMQSSMAEVTTSTYESLMSGGDMPSALANGSYASIMSAVTTTSGDVPIGMATVGSYNSSEFGNSFGNCSAVPPNMGLSNTSGLGSWSGNGLANSSLPVTPVNGAVKLPLSKFVAFISVLGALAVFM